MTIEELEKKIQGRVAFVKKGLPCEVGNLTTLATEILENQADLAKMIRNIKEGLS